MELSGQPRGLAYLPARREPPKPHCLGIWMGANAGLNFLEQGPFSLPVCDPHPVA